MAQHDENFKETCSPWWIPVGLVVLLAMPALPMVIGWSKVIF
ncbi:hypothetical protein [Marinospirillum celere]|nr:hypothetical protein [Marinospirillum celere]